jgi:hypothetical protein
MLQNRLLLALLVLLNRLRLALLVLLNQKQDEVDENPRTEIQQLLEIHLYQQETTLLTS